MGRGNGLGEKGARWGRQRGCCLDGEGNKMEFDRIKEDGRAVRRRHQVKLPGEETDRQAGK